MHPMRSRISDRDRFCENTAGVSPVKAGIDQIDIEQKDKNALKLFFGREIEDIIGKDEKDRYEKHEPATHWIEKLTEQQFSIKNECLVSPVSSAGSVKIQHHQEGFLGFTFDKETVLAVIYAN